MSTLVTYKEIDGGDVQEVSPDPSATGGLALNTNFRAIADSLPRNNYGASTNPLPTNDSVDTAGIGVDFAKGSRWYNGTTIFECVDPTPMAAVWVQTIENIDGTISLGGATLNFNTGSGSGGGTLNMDAGTFNFGTGATMVDDGEGGIIWGMSGISSNVMQLDNYAIALEFNDITLNMQGSNLNLNNGSGSGGGALNLDQATVNFGTGAYMQDDGNGGINFIDNGGNVLNWNLNNQNGLTFGAGGSIQGNGPGSLDVNGVGIDANADIYMYGSINMNGSGEGGENLNMGRGTGFGGGNIFMDGGTIVQLRADNQSSAPSSPNLGQIYYDTTSNHFFGWNGTAWKQLDN
jgi:hypothetical protein